MRPTAAASINPSITTQPSRSMASAKIAPGVDAANL
jgi:hypothetical protein